MALKEKRLERGLTLQQLAEVSGVHYVTISRIETGKIKPENITVKNARKLTDALGCEIEDIT